MIDGAAYEESRAGRRRREKWRTTIWTTKKIGAYPNIYMEVDGANGDQVILWFATQSGVNMTGFRIGRSHARLVARRILQCLEDTK